MLLIMSFTYMYLNKSGKVIILMKSEKITSIKTLTLKLQQI